MAVSSQQHVYPSCELYDLVIDMDWDAVTIHAKKHPVDAQWEDHDGRDGGETPLYLASQYGAPLEVIQAIISAYPQALRVQNRNGNSPLHIACHYDVNVEIIRALVEADPGTVFLGTKWGKTPMNALYDGILKRADRTDISTIEDGQWEKIMVLLRAVAMEESLVSLDGEMLYVHAAVSLGGFGCPRRVFELVVDRFPEQVFKRDVLGRLPIHLAAGPIRKIRFRHFVRRNNSTREQHVFARLLKEYPQSAQVVDPQGRWPLHIALGNGRTWEGGVEMLFQAAPRAISVVDPVTGLFPFMLTAQEKKSDLDTVFLLLLSQPDVLNSCRPVKESKTKDLITMLSFEDLHDKWHCAVTRTMPHRRISNAACVAICSICVGILMTSRRSR